LQRRLLGFVPDASCYGDEPASLCENLPSVINLTCIGDHHDIYMTHMTILRISYMSVTTIPDKANPLCRNRMVDQIETKKGLPKPSGFYT
jgi:hypothetical protein